MFTSVDSSWTRRLLSSLALALALVACGDDSGDGDDKDDESEVDSGPNKDGGPKKDGSIDGGGDDEDDAGPSDASKPTDAKVSDASKDSATSDASSTAIPTFNGCAENNYVDLSAESADRVIKFGGSLLNKYDPKCIIIAVGQTVKFEGSFSAHNLVRGEPAAENAGTANSPIPDGAAAIKTGTTKTFTFSAAGTFPYHCVQHAMVNMVGSIHVK